MVAMFSDFATAGDTIEAQAAALRGSLAEVFDSSAEFGRRVPLLAQ